MKARVFAAAVAAALIPMLVQPAEAGHRKRHHSHLTHHHAVRSGACDGFHRCRCGVTAARKAGLPLDYKGHNLKRAVEWKHAFPHASMPFVGAVVYQVGGGPSGHVSTIVGLGSRCTATVYDDAGTYERNICTRSAVILNVGGHATASLTVGPTF